MKVVAQSHGRRAPNCCCLSPKADLERRTRRARHQVLGERFREADQSKGRSGGGDRAASEGSEGIRGPTRAVRQAPGATWGCAGSAWRRGYGWPAGAAACAWGRQQRCRIAPREPRLRPRAGPAPTRSPGLEPPALVLTPRGCLCFPRQARPGSPHTGWRVRCSAGKGGSSGAPSSPHLFRDFSSVLTFRLSSALQPVEAKSFAFQADLGDSPRLSNLRK